MSRSAVLGDDMWARLEPLLPSTDGLRGRRFRDHRRVIEGIIFRQRAGCTWRDLPTEFGPWQTVWKCHARLRRDGTWDQILTVLLTEADARGELDWTVSVDSTVARAHQHAANLTREVVASGESDTGGSIE
jgi:transposase